MEIANLNLWTIIDNSPLSIYILGSDGYFKLVNSQLVQLSGYTREEMLRTHFTKLIYQKDLNFVVQQVQNRLQKNNAPNNYEFRAVTKSGSVLFVRGYFSVINIDSENAILGQLLDVTENKKMESDLKKSEERYRSILYNSWVGYFEVDLAGNFIYFNDAVNETLGYTREELLGINNRSYTDEKNAKKVFKAFNKVYHSERPEKFFDWELLCKDGSRRNVETSVDLIRNEKGEKIGFRGLVQDVTERKKAEHQLKKSEERYRAIFEGSGTPMIIIEPDTTISMVNKKFEKLSGYTKEEVENLKSWTEFVSPRDLQRMQEYHNQRRINHKAAPGQYEFTFINRQKEERYLLNTVSIMPDEKTVASFLDLTERKKLEEELKHLSLHDAMTGLYNRHYFEQELRRLQDGRNFPVGVVVCDVDGLKQINDNHGHKEGDKLIKSASKVIRDSFRESDMVARIGGDEFGIILPRCEHSIIKNILNRLKDSIEKYNAKSPKFSLSISIGYALSSDGQTDMDLLFKKADQNMYKDKLKNQSSCRSDTVQVLRTILKNKGLLKEGEDMRMQKLTQEFAQTLHLSENQFSDLQPLAQFHDIGNVCLNDSILFKPEKLTCEEFKQIQKHCKSGHLIAQSASDLIPISDYILTHHEWWNGQGYPLGLKGEEIPYLCRILSIVEAYWAMTNDRPYRKAMSKQATIKELRNCAGTQFDPSLVEDFIKFLEENS